MRCERNGEDMSLKTFKDALKIEDSIDIGGGEPTIHKDFLKMLALAIANSEYVWLATNGSKTETALMLAKMAEKGVIGCALSLDPWHDPISGKVIQAFQKRDMNEYGQKNYHDLREIRDVSKNYETMSPWRNPEDGGNEEECICEELFVKTNGDVHVCGCFDSPKIGNVSEKFSIPESYEYSTCWKKQCKIEV
jgi:MoaA/NifB/PqqE/SkfB family radical SAM enzyme